MDANRSCININFVFLLLSTGPSAVFTLPVLGSFCWFVLFSCVFSFSCTFAAFLFCNVILVLLLACFLCAHGASFGGIGGGRMAAAGRRPGSAVGGWRRRGGFGGTADASRIDCDGGGYLFPKVAVRRFGVCMVRRRSRPRRRRRLFLWLPLSRYETRCPKANSEKR